MPVKQQFQPDYAIHPGATISDWLEETGSSLVDLAEKSGLDMETLKGLLAWRVEVTEHIALKLAECIGSSAQFWLNHQRNFSANCKRLGVSNEEAAERWK
jgi:HTH-type transcriptional regulator / antitoxin HigA